jgi:hypothetical protein
MAITYLDPSAVLAKRQTEAPPNRSRTGYGNKIPTSWELQLADKRWRRVYVICYSNAGSAYIRTKNGSLFLGSYDPSQA